MREVNEDKFVLSPEKRTSEKWVPIPKLPVTRRVSVSTGFFTERPTGPSLSAEDREGGVMPQLTFPPLSVLACRPTMGGAYALQVVWVTLALTDRG
jgi:hypothetical protein